MNQPRRRPNRWTKAVFDAPTLLYRHRLGWLLGRRFLAVTHVGRTSGKLNETVLEVVSHERESGESIVASAYGATADWYRNLQQTPARLVRTGRRQFVPEQRFLAQDEARATAVAFRQAHPLEARLANRVMAVIGAVPRDTFSDPVDLFASFPMIAFRPSGSGPMGSDQQSRTFVPGGFVVPPELICEQFRVEPLGPQHNAGDYEAWTSSIDHIRATPGFPIGDWPRPGTTLEENLADLREHADDYARRSGFTYTVLESGTDRIVGCLYIYPSAEGGAADVRSWVRADRADLDVVLQDAVSAWLDAEWPFEEVVYAPR